MSISFQTAIYFNLHSAMAMIKSVLLNVAQFLSFNDLLLLKQSNALSLKTLTPKTRKH